MDRQLSFATLDYAGKKKRTRRDAFRHAARRHTGQGEAPRHENQKFLHRAEDAG